MVIRVSLHEIALEFLKRAVALLVCIALAVPAARASSPLNKAGEPSLEKIAAFLNGFQNAGSLLRYVAVLTGENPEQLIAKFRKSGLDPNSPLPKIEARGETSNGSLRIPGLPEISFSLSGRNLKYTIANSHWDYGAHGLARNFSQLEQWLAGAEKAPAKKRALLPSLIERAEAYEVIGQRQERNRMLAILGALGFAALLCVAAVKGSMFVIFAAAAVASVIALVFLSKFLGVLHTPLRMLSELPCDADSMQKVATNSPAPGAFLSSYQAICKDEGKRRMANTMIAGLSRKMESGEIKIAGLETAVSAPAAKGSRPDGVEAGGVNDGAAPPVGGEAAL